MGDKDNKVLKLGPGPCCYFLLVQVLCCHLTLTHAFDINTAISHLATLGKFPMSLAELKELATPSVLQKLMQGSKGVLPSMPDLASFTRGDPANLAKILAKLKPSQGRFEPEMEELFNSAFNLNSSPRSRAADATMVEDSTNSGVTVKRGVYHPPTHPHSSTGDPGTIMTRNGIRRFSSKFNRRTQSYREHERERPTTPVMVTRPWPYDEEESQEEPEPEESASSKVPNKTEVPPPYDHITDPNIRNHRLFDNYENFTVLDQPEDLMMDETFVIPITTEAGTGTTTSGWVGVSHQSKPPKGENEDPFLKLDREPLSENSAEEHEHYPPPHSSEEQNSVNTENYFRPSPPDVNMVKFVEPGQEFFTSTIRAEKPAFVMPEFPPPSSKVRRKQDRILNQKQNYDKEFLNNYAPPHKYNAPPQLVPNHHQRIHVYPPAPHPIPHLPQNFGYNAHPFSHYSPFRRVQHQPGKFSQNQHHQLDSSDETEASDKNDTGWSSTFFLLGGLVAASAIMAFVLPGILGTASVAGKDSQDFGNDLTHDSSNRDFWEEVKGLYNDLSHVANGDFEYFNNKGSPSNVVVGERWSSTTSTSTEKVNNSPEVDRIGEEIESAAVTEAEENEKTLAFPVNSGWGPNRYNFTNMNSTRGSRVHNNTFLREWARVQLQLIDS